MNKTFAIATLAATLALPAMAHANTSADCSISDIKCGFSDNLVGNSVKSYRLAGETSGSGASVDFYVADSKDKASQIVKIYRSNPDLARLNSKVQPIGVEF